MAEVAHWDSFYVIIGSAAGALVGLMFVVLTLIAERPPQRAEEASAAFASPTIVHFAGVLLVSAVARMPWHSISSLAAACGIVGVAGVVYIGIVVRRMLTQGAYKPDLEDWLSHAIAPLAGYATLAISALAMPSNEGESLFGVGAAMLLLLFTSIHNAWDAVTYHVLVSRPVRPTV